MSNLRTLEIENERLRQERIGLIAALDKYSEVDSLLEALRDLPHSTEFAGNRYDTDDKHILHLWLKDGRSFDLMMYREDQPGAAAIGSKPTIGTHLVFTGKEESRPFSCCCNAPISSKPGSVGPYLFCLRCGWECKIRLRLIRTDMA